jgi:sec-independent protein translocase protein TatB
VFGMSFGELCVLVIVAIVVIGPKDLPRYLRKAGQFAGRLRRMAFDVRAQSGIDEVLRSEGLTRDIAEIRRLASGDFIANTVGPIAASVNAQASANAPVAAPAPEPPMANDVMVVREREYPREGADSYGAMLDTAIVYAQGLPVSALARDPLYVVGDADAPLPPEPDPEVSPGADEGGHDASAAESAGISSPDAEHA